VLLQRLLVLPAVRHAQTSSMPSRIATLSAADDAQREARGKQANGLGRATGLHNEKGHGRPWPGHPRLACSGLS
jgi:hypothetical protein